jgi:hypothetical protein
MINRRFIPPSQRRPVFASIPGQPGLKRFVGFEGDPGTESVRPTNRTGLGSLGTSDRRTWVPKPDGTPGNPFTGDYDERSIWGTNDPGGQVVAPIDPSTAVAPTPGPQVFDPGISIPFGISIIKWRNPTTMQSVPILASTSIIQPVLSLNMARNSLLIQNNSTATSPDVAPTFWIGFNAQPQVGFSLSLAPGAGLLFDVITPRDSIYVLPAGAVGASAVTQGVIVQGTYAPL